MSYAQVGRGWARNTLLPTSALAVHISPIRVQLPASWGWSMDRFRLNAPASGACMAEDPPILGTGKLWVRTVCNRVLTLPIPPPIGYNLFCTEHLSQVT